MTPPRERSLADRDRDTRGMDDAHVLVLHCITGDRPAGDIVRDGARAPTSRAGKVAVRFAA